MRYKNVIFGKVFVKNAKNNPRTLLKVPKLVRSENVRIVHWVSFPILIHRDLKSRPRSNRLAASSLSVQVKRCHSNRNRSRPSSAKCGRIKSRAICDRHVSRDAAIRLPRLLYNLTGFRLRNLSVEGGGRTGRLSHFQIETLTWCYSTPSPSLPRL